MNHLCNHLCFPLAAVQEVAVRRGRRLQPIAAMSITPLPPSMTANSLAAGLVARSMKVVSALQKRCDACRIVRRGKIHYVYCLANAKHKARQGPKRRKKLK